MAIAFSADEVLEMAETIERNGARFYRKASESNAELKDLLLEIAAQEEEHLAMFSGMRSELQGREAEPTAFDPDGEAALYLKTMASGHVFKDDEAQGEALTGQETAREIIDIAIGKEKDSIVFYVPLKELVPTKSGRDKMDVIIREEIRHIRWLSEKLADIEAMMAGK